MPKGYITVPQQDEGEAFDFTSIFTYSAYNKLNDNFDVTSFSGLKRKVADHVFHKRFRSRNSVVTGEDENAGTCRRSVVESIVIAVCFLMFVITAPFSLLLCLKFVKRFERLVVFRLGRLQKAKGPGAVVVLPCVDSWHRVDLRTKAFNVPPLQAVTADGGVVELGAEVCYHIADAQAAVVSVQDWLSAARTLAHATLHRQLNKRPLADLAADRRAAARQLLEELNRSTFTWGMEVTDVELSELKILKEANDNTSNVLQALSQPQVMNQLMDHLGQFAIPNLQAQQPLNHPKDFTAIQVEDIIGDSGGGVAVEKQPGPASSELSALLRSLNNVLDETVVASVGYTYQIHCDGLGTFYLDLKTGGGRAGPGPLPGDTSPDVLIRLDLEHFQRLMDGSLNPLDAFLSGDIRIEGDTRAAMSLSTLADHVKMAERAPVTVERSVSNYLNQPM